MGLFALPRPRVHRLLALPLAMLAAEVSRPRLPSTKGFWGRCRGGYSDILCEYSYISERVMPLYIKDDATAKLVAQFAKLRGLSKQDAVKMAVQTALDRAARRCRCETASPRCGRPISCRRPTGQCRR